MTMEFILHFMYVVAIKDRKAWVGAGPAQISMIGFWNLIIVWLEVQFFRWGWGLWSVNDGFVLFLASDTVEVLPVVGAHGWD